MASFSWRRTAPVAQSVCRVKRLVNSGASRIGLCEEIKFCCEIELSHFIDQIITCGKGLASSTETAFTRCLSVLKHCWPSVSDGVPVVEDGKLPAA